jgi:hypothetical protein
MGTPLSAFVPPADCCFGSAHSVSIPCYNISAGRSIDKAFDVQLLLLVKVKESKC